MGRNLFLAFRVFVFGLFIICNAILCTVGIVDLNLATAVNVNAQADIFAIFVGITGLLLMCPILLTEVMRRPTAWTRVWFEISWSAIFTLLYIIAAANLTLGMDTAMCSENVISIFSDSCTVTRALIAFGWLGFILLFQYMVVLIFCSFQHREEDSRIWRVEVSHFPWFATPWLPEDKKRSITSLPSVTEKKGRGPASLVNWGRGGLGAEYVIEPYRIGTPARSTSNASTIPPTPPPKPKKHWSWGKRSKDRGLARETSAASTLPNPHHSVSSVSSSGGIPASRAFLGLPAMPQRVRQLPARPQVNILVPNPIDRHSFQSDLSNASLPNPHEVFAPLNSPSIPSPSRRPLGPRRPSIGIEEALRVPPVTLAAPPRYRQPPLRLDMSFLNQR